MITDAPTHISYHENVTITPNVNATNTTNVTVAPDAVDSSGGGGTSGGIDIVGLHEEEPQDAVSYQAVDKEKQDKDDTRRVLLLAN
jgi:hypothetical protein